MLRLGGLFTSATKAEQDPAKLRVANNVTFNKDGTLLPRPSMLAPYVTGSVVRWNHLSSYSGPNLFAMGVVGASNRTSTAYVNNVIIPRTSDLPIDYVGTYGKNFETQSFEIGKVKYVLAGAATTYSTLYKYDGQEIYRAGLPTPYFQPQGYSATDTNNLIAINHSLDFQGNSTTSDIVRWKSNGNTAGFESIVYGNGLFVGVGNNGMSFSPDGINWDSNCSYPLAVSFGLGVSTFVGVTFGSTVGATGRFVAVSNTGSAGGILYSDDGKIWRRDLFIPSHVWTAVTFHNGLFVAINTSATLAQKIMTSPDGVTWTYRTAPNANNYTAIVGGNGIFVAIANSGVGNRVMTSADGITWVARVSPADTGWSAITFGNNTWVAVADGGATTTQIMTNINPHSATAWTLRTSPTANSWRGIAYGNVLGVNLFVAAAQTGTIGTRIMTSADGTTWTNRTAASLFFHKAVAFGNISGTTGIFVVGAFDGGVGQGLMYATFADPATWISTPSPVNLKITASGMASSDVEGFQTLFGNTIKFTEPTNGRMDSFFKGQSDFNVGSNEFDITLAMPGEEFNYIGENPTGNTHVIRVISFVHAGTTYSAAAYKYKPGGLKFYSTVKLYNTGSLLWEEFEAGVLPAIIKNAYFIASRRVMSVWASASAQGIYYFKGLVPVISTKAALLPSVYFTVNIGNPTFENTVTRAITTPFQMSGSLGAWYDVTSAKSSFNTIREPLVALTSYQDLLVIATEELIYFSDYTLGTTLEMRSALSNLKIGDTEQGKITSVVGTKDFLIVSRERKVYYVSGNIGTQNIRVQEIPEISVGAYNNSSMLEIEGTVLLLSSVGVYLISGTSATKVSGGIEPNFKTFMKNPTLQLPAVENNEIIFNMNNYPATAWSSTTDRRIMSAYDSYRRLVIFTDNTTAKSGNSIVLHGSNGQITNWNGYDAAGSDFTAMTFINGTAHIATAISNIAKILVEDTSPSVYTYDYTSRSPARFATTWLTFGEPSLEKQLQQIKMYGYIWSDLSVKHYIDWDLTTAVTDTTYTTPGIYKFFHKQRLTSSKPLAASIEVSMLAGGSSFWIDGIEVELQEIQSGIKK
jgi:hypothetical protein